MSGSSSSTPASAAPETGAEGDGAREFDSARDLLDAPRDMLDSMLDDSAEDDEDEPRPPRRRGRLVGWTLLVVFVLLFASGAVWLHDVVTQPAPHPQSLQPTFLIEPLQVAPNSAIPSAAAPVPAAGTGPRDPRAAWVGRIATATYVPQRALQAYVNAQTSIATSDPGCHLSWTTLAGVGYEESKHGQFQGDSIGPDGVEVTPIIGPALDGTDGTLRIPDTQHAALDGDPQWAHALGPMQFLPSTWSRWGARASGDGRAPDPQDMDDAALTAGRYLCATGTDLAVPGNWWSAVLVYNNSVSYGQAVFSAADAYARATH